VLQIGYNKPSRPLTFKRQVISELMDQLFDAIEIINSSATIPLTFVIINILSLDVFAIYTIWREFLSSTNMFWHQFINTSFWILAQYWMKSLMALMGSSTTKEAERGGLIVLKAMGSLDSDHNLQKDLKLFYRQLKGRNKTLENELFAINWKTLILTVSVSSMKTDLNIIPLFSR
jgi:hypothetical protein